MKILIIGGTKFLGRHIIDAARGHEVTLFNRGNNAIKVEGVEQIHGDRNADLEKLAGRRFDVCIDTCGYLPQHVEASAQLLSDAIERYVFISSISAYANFKTPDFDETAPTAELNKEQRERFAAIDPRGEINASVLGEIYGALKAMCENAAEEAMPGRVLNIRPGLIVGKYDWTDRFSYWVMRVARGGKVLAPGNPECFIQFVDARDLADWIVSMAENKMTGTFNATGKPFDLTFGAFLNEIKRVTSSDAEFVWASEDVLRKEKVKEWSDMPLYLHESEESMRGFLSANVDRAINNGLRFRPLAETIQKTYEWRRGSTDELRAGVSPDLEAQLLNSQLNRLGKSVL